MPGPIEINKQGRPDPNQGAEVMKQLARLPGAAIRRNGSFRGPLGFPTRDIYL